jgi:AraC-like DNA-binding protein
MEPLAAIVSMLGAHTMSPKIISGAGKWGVRYTRVDTAGFGLVLLGQCALHVNGAAPLQLAKGDFVLMPPTSGFAMYSDPDVEPVTLSPDASVGLSELRHGDREGEAEFKLLGGYFRFESTNMDLLVGLLPKLVHIRGSDIAAKRLADTIELIADEASNQRPGRDLIVEHLVEVMLVEALRFRTPEIDATLRPGLLEGLADANLANALRCIHADVARDWTVGELARHAGLSRSAFSDRFTHKVGTPPMEYLIQWRMALAKDMLQREPMPLEEVAAAIGYESASAFSTAFRRRVGRPPSQFARGFTPVCRPSGS